ncbi:hypothetical protein HYW94_04180 [Candidatus Uhrbacteria bacterium]|nr:hypothetical protein [Candidatus Uhrbacteria bacterium]
MKYGNLTLGQIEAGINKIGGEERFILLLQDKLVITQKVQEQPAPVPVATVPLEPREWQVWKTLKNNNELKTADQFRKALKKAKRKIGDWGNDILGRVDLMEGIDQDEYELVIASGRELGFTKAVTRKELQERAYQLGLEKCPARVGPLLRVEYGDQPNGERLLVDMEAVAVSVGGLDVFYVGRDSDDLWLDAGSGHPDDGWGPDRWMFLRRKSV